MACILEAKALRPSLRNELTQQEIFEEFYNNCSTTTTCVTTAGEDFSIDELLNLQNGEFEDGCVEEEEKDSLFVDDENFNFSGNFSGAGEDSESLLTSELVVPVSKVFWVFVYFY